MQRCEEELAVLQNLLASSLDVICSIDAEGRFMYVSPASQHVWGYLPQEVVGKKYMDMVIAEDHAKTAAAGKAIVGGKNITSFENRYRKKDGSIVPMLWSARWNKEEQVLYCVAKDATQIKEMEKQKLLQERRLRRAYKLTEIAWWEYDVATQTYTSSDEIFHIYGLPIPKNNQNSLQDFLSRVHPDDVAKLQRDLSAVCQDTYFNYEHRIVKPSGEVIYVIHYSEVIRDSDGNPIAIHGTTKDITKRKLQQLKLEASEQRLQEYSQQLSTILESIGDGFFTVDREWKTTYWNRKAEEILQKKKEDILGKNVWEVYPEAVPLKFYKEYHRAIVENTPVHFEEYLASANIWLEVSAFPSSEGLSVYFQNITERKLQEKALQLAHERFELASKATSDVVWDWDLHTDEVYFSENYTQLFGHELTSDNVHKAWGEYVHPEDWTATLASLQNALNDSSVQQWEAAYRFYRKDKSVAHVYDRGYIMRDADGTALRMVGSIQDITKLKEAECAIARSERRFKAMVQSGKDLIMLLNPSFECIYTSPNYKAVLGYSPDELSGFLPHDKVHPDDYQHLLQAAQAIFTTPSVLLPRFRFQTKDGNYRWYEATLSNNLTNPDIEAIVSNIRDVTERVAAEEEMRKLSLVAKETVNAVIITDAEDKIIWVNKAFSDITEYSFEEALGKQPGVLLQGEKTSERTRHYLRKCVAHRLPFSCEILNYTKSGREYWLEIKGQPLFNEQGELKSFFAIQTDITARKEAEAALKTSEEKYKLLFSTSPLPKWIFDAETLTVVDVNKASCDLYGYSREEFLRMKMQDLRNPEDEAEMYTAIQGLISKKSKSFNKVVRHKKKNGETFYIDITSFPIELATGLHFMVSGTDMTEKLQLQQQLIAEKVAAQKKVARAIIQAQETERSEIGKEMHDNVCQLLTTSKLYIENVKHCPEQQDTFLKKGVDLLLQSINEIRYLSRQLVSPVLSDDSFEASVGEVLHHYRSLNLFEIGFRYEAGVELLDRDLKTTIIRILQEAFNNTVKYAKASTVHVSISSTADTLRFSYSDNGVGFDPGSTKRGIGLSNIKNRADAYRGKVAVRAAPEKGCTIDISFPLTEKTEPVQFTSLIQA
ncbi:MAG TPA: PAS domain S-box protein [Flavisolibacter sp.]|nr:PAS domain S-box protein [Flavisolibacter sp.]